jgi:uncharacterized protein
MRTGTTNLPLHTGNAPSWLFGRMVKLSREIISLMVMECGTQIVLEKLSDPYWFQALGCVLGFDWHSSGLTTTTCGAIKEGIKGTEHELGFFACGGKGSASRKTPIQIRTYAEKYPVTVDAQKLVYASKMSATVDSAAVQDGYNLYHHVFFFDSSGRWTVVQQGMHDVNGWARRYHWLSTGFDDFVCEPHAAVCSDKRTDIDLNMVAGEAGENRITTAHLACEKPEKALLEIEKIRELILPKRHDIRPIDITPAYLHKVLLKTYDLQPQNFEQLLGTEGVGGKTIRALAMISDLVYGAPLSKRDPAAYSFAHGGKDGIPYPVDRKSYDNTIEIVRKAVEKAKLGNSDTTNAIKRLSLFYDF